MSNMNTLPPPIDLPTFDQHPLPSQEQVHSNPDTVGRSPLYQSHLEAAGGNFDGSGGKLLQQHAEADDRWYQMRQRGLAKLDERFAAQRAEREAKEAAEDAARYPE